jgi:ArsR family transcriptional regulator, arsenate/arsenite/antimonite-responsive transcriptional repressor
MASAPREPEHLVPDFSAQDLPHAVIERIADRFRLLGDPTRLRLVNALHVDGELSVGELVARVGTSYGAVSKQLALLRSHGLVARRREGTRIHYRICDPSLSDLCDAVCKSIRDDWARWGATLERELQGGETR